jgi:uncharacterized protein (TIGR02246 family)
MNGRIAGLAAALATLSITIAPASGQASDPRAAADLAAVRRAIDAGNAQWSEGWAKRDGPMVAAIFAGDGVQLATNGRIIKGRQQIQERQAAAMAGADSGVKVTITTVNVWLDGDTAYETGTYKYE